MSEKEKQNDEKQNDEKQCEKQKQCDKKDGALSGNRLDNTKEDTIKKCSARRVTDWESELHWAFY
jgi:hypothetical protein